MPILRIIFQGHHYTTSADLWSLGAVISFRCNKQHLFTSFRSVERWTGGRSSLDRRKYGLSLRRLLRHMLSPVAARRPSAQEVLQECRRDSRQQPRAHSI